MTLRLIASTALLLIFTSTSQAKSWRGITPLKSTRADVERLLGKPNNLGRYQFENERASIHYAETGCDRPSDCTCLVPKDTVLHVFVTIEVEMKFSALKIDKAKYEKRRDRHLLTFVSYSNADEGVVYIVADDEVTDTQAKKDIADQVGNFYGFNEFSNLKPAMDSIREIHRRDQHYGH